MKKRQDETADQIARETFREALEQVRDEIVKIRTGKKKPKKFTPTESVVFLAKQASTIAAELRKAEAAAQKRASHITEALVVEWFRQLDASEQRRILAALQALNANTKRSGLA